MAMSDGSDLGVRLRQVRTEKGLSLREVAGRADVNHGYLSQLERGEVAQPAPAILHKLAAGYGEPFVVLMRWAGYIEDDQQGLSPNQARALSYLGDDVSDHELEAIRAVLDAIRARRATFTPAASLDGELDPDDVGRIRRHVLQLLRKADADGVIPTPIDEVMAVAKLVSVGEVTLEPEERRRLRRVFGSLVDHVVDRLQGAIHFRSREVWVKPDLYPPRKRFVCSHEIGHDVLPWHRELFAYLDDCSRLRPDVRNLYERQANQAAIELLAQGDRLRREADDSLLTMRLVSELSGRFSISLQATARRIVEETKQECALALAFRGSTTGTPMQHHLYCSSSFEKRFRWKATGAATSLVQQTIRAACRSQAHESLVVLGMNGHSATLQIDSAITPRAVLVIFRSQPTKLRSINTLRALVR
jgi:transcriptional regulator with XRE-family HTH domain/Zn-dependent peptidase ImmA (M78 family)